MRRSVSTLWSTLAFALVLTAAAPAPARADEGAAVRDVIGAQIRAFLREDVTEAFGFASPGIRRLFGTPEVFGHMVRHGYPMVWKPRDWRFSALAPQGEGLRQTVVITNAVGRLHVADYDMVLVEGVWRIDGVRLRPAEGAGA